MKNLKMSFGVMLLAVSLAGCQKTRDATIKDAEVASSTFEIAELQNKEFSLKTGDSLNSSAIAGKPQAVNEKPKSKVASATVPDRLQGLFKNVQVSAAANRDYPIRTLLTKKTLSVFKLVQDKGELTELEKQLALSENGQQAVLLMQVPVKDYGVLERAKNENGDVTSNLVFVHTDFQAATHVQLSLNADDVVSAGGSVENQKSLEEIFLVDRLNKKVSKLDELQAALKFSLSGVSDKKVYSVVSAEAGSDVSILIYSIVKKSDIQDEKLIAKLNSSLDIDKSYIDYCPKEVLAELTAAEQKDCVILLSYSLKAQAVKAELVKADPLDGSVSADATFTPAKSQGAKLIQITDNSVVETVQKSKMDPSNTILVSDIKGKEFLLRRTFEDGANSIMVFGPGASGDLDIVKFELEDTRLVVRRATSINGDPKSDDFDREELMSIPVTYYGLDPKSGVANPSLIEATKDKAKYVYLDWTKNSLPALNSPLAYFDAGQCFEAVGSQSVSNLNSQINKGVLSFSISGSYSFKPDCMSFYQMHDYWYGGALQGAFNIKERVSFKLHDPDLDSKVTDFPARAQHLLNFGVFTSGKLKPDDFGNTGQVENEEAHMVIHDFTGGKQLVYHLGGLPASGWMRDALIEGTKEVIAEWNQGLHIAFADTDLARSGDYVLLKVDGIDDVPGKLGDLDRNYIWNYEKNLDSGLLGMSQAGPNPRSGRIEQNNVLMYSGNLLSNIGYYKERAKIQKAYADMKAAVLAAAATGETLPDDGTDIAGPAEEEAIEDGITWVKELNEKSQIAKAFTPILKPVASSAMPVRASMAKSELTGIARDMGNGIARKNSMVAKLGETAYLQRIYQKAIEMGITKDALAMEALSSAEVLKAFGPKLSQAEKTNLALQSRRLALMAEFAKTMNKGPSCALAGADIPSAASSDPDLLDDTKTAAVFKKWYKATLLHEVGHSLGLTHNFKGSTDAANFARLGDGANEKRNYSSIMDYVPDQFISYHGPGLYDLRALRVAYTGLIELNPALQQAAEAGQIPKELPVQNLKGKNQFKLEVKLEDFKKYVLGKNSWWKLDAAKVASVPLKPYAYCTDIHVGGEPNCNRWDMGTDDTEIAKFYIQEYKDLYPVLNHIGNKINIRGIGAYISRVFYEFEGVRPFLDETFYRVIQGYPQAAWLPTAYGAVEGWKFFNEVISTPSSNLPFSSLDRFSVHEYEYKDEAGKTQKAKVVVEAKPMTDLAVPGMPDQIDTRGIELDKAIALIMLTQRGIGNPRYESISLRISYAELEKYLLGTESFGEMLSMQTLKGILTDNQTAYVSDGDRFVNLPASYQPAVTDLVRTYAIYGAGIFLDADTLEDKANFAVAFRTGSSQKTTPKGRFAVTKLDNSISSPTSLKLWSMDNSDISSDMVRNAAQQRALIENEGKLSPKLSKYFLALRGNKPAEAASAKEDVVKVLTALNKDGLLFNKEEAAAGLSYDVILNFTVNFMNAQEGIAAQLGPQIEALPEDAEAQIIQALGPILKDAAKQNEVTAKNIPYAGLAMKTLLKLREGSTAKPDWAVNLVYQVLLDGTVLESNYGMTVNNLSVLNKILYQMYPELNNFN
jgi:hypothetical protein